ncbi:pabA, partial [Symbiodinium microadriaticum]
MLRGEKKADTPADPPAQPTEKKKPSTADILAMARGKKTTETKKEESSSAKDKELTTAEKLALLRGEKKTEAAADDKSSDEPTPKKPSTADILAMARGQKKKSVDDSSSGNGGLREDSNNPFASRLAPLNCRMILLIDNYDSFTYNLVQRLGEIDPTLDLQVYRNDQIDCATIEKLAPTHLIVSPGPCTPNEAGISVEAISHFAEKLPILGVCLGHQSMGQAFGGTIVRAERLMHGKTDEIHHDGKGLFEGMPNPFIATRYHSLVIKPDTLPDGFE